MSKPAGMSNKARAAVRRDGTDAAIKYDADDASTHMKSAGIPPRVSSTVSVRHVIRSRVDFTCCNKK